MDGRDKRRPCYPALGLKALRLHCLFIVAQWLAEVLSLSWSLLLIELLIQGDKDVEFNALRRTNNCHWR